MSAVFTIREDPFERKFCRTYVSEQDRHGKPCETPLLYKYGLSSTRHTKLYSYNCQKICNGAIIPESI